MSTSTALIVVAYAIVALVLAVLAIGLKRGERYRSVLEGIALGLCAGVLLAPLLGFTP
jgi:uncharacterized membrane protein YgaE (UPF0421/DUF939 family)